MPETSDKTRVVVVSHDDPAPTVMANGLGDAKHSQVYVIGAEMPKPARKHVRADEGGARRLNDQPAEPAPTVMAGGIGSVNTGQYRIGEPEDRPAEPGKPPYRVPSMAEVRATPWNGLTVASTFSGCGGSCLGYRMAGFRVAWANEFVPSAIASYRANAAAGSVLDERDIRTVKPEEILRACGLRKGQLDLFDGSPPCQAFSTAGKRHEGWGEEKAYEGGHKQRNEDLFFEWLRLLRGLMPRCFVAENVSGLVKGTCKGMFLEILKSMKAAGYKVSCRVLDAQWLGVPQCRQRTIFVGVREDLRREPAHPSPLTYRYSVRDAIPWIAGVDQGSVYDEENRSTTGDEPCPTVKALGIGAQVRNKVRIIQQQGAPGVGRKEVDHGRPLPTVCATQAQQFIVEPDSDIARFAIGREWAGLKMGEGSDKYLNLVRSDVTRPSPTICAEHGHGGIAGVTHPLERRKFSIAELKRICSFPDDFALAGSYAQQWACLGNSVPPLMMRAVAEVVRDRVLLPVRGTRR